MYRTLTRRPRLAVDPLEARDVPAVVGPLAVDPTEYAGDRVIVKLNSAAAPRSPLTTKAEALGFGLYAVHLRSGVTVDRALKYFHARPGVAIAEPDYIVHADLTPNDPGFGNLYGMNNTGQSGGTPDDDIDAPEAWDVSTGSGNMVVAVIDTGINYNHIDLAANMWHNAADPIDGVDNDGNGLVDDYYGADYANNDGDPMDDNGHGTHCAGTIGGVGNNGVGVAGVNWHVKLMAVKFLGANGSGAISNAVKCLNYAVSHGARVSSNSWGGGGLSFAMSAAIDSARAAGDLFIAAAGNNASNNDAVPFFPANYPQDNVLAVAATDANDNLASFSDYGATTVDLAAPGVNIYSTYGANYAYLSGTSMATPHVAGAAALVWDAHPTWTYQDVVTALTSTVDPKANLAGKVVTGGRLNVNAAIRYGAPPPPDAGGPKVISADFSGISGGFNKVRLTFDEPILPASVDLMDANLTGVMGTVGPTGVTVVAPTQVDFAFAPQTAPGNYDLVVGLNITDLAGNLMNQDGDGTNGEVPDDQYRTTYTINSSQRYNSADVNKPIVDAARTVSVLDVMASGPIHDVNVTLNLTHTSDSDLVITLVAPDGTSVLLVNQRGGIGDNFTNTVLDDEATRSIAVGAAPFIGSFRPEQALSAFDGRTATGRWQLVIDDVARADSGWINAWSLTIS